MNNLPCACAALTAGPIGIENKEKNNIPYISLNDIQVICRHFDFRKQFLANISKWINFRYDAKALTKTFLLLPFMRYTGFHECHTANSYLKSTFIEVWEKEKDILEETSSHRFRDKSDVNQWLMEYWQIMSGKFFPKRTRTIAGYNIDPDNLKSAVYDVKHHKHKVICLNDGEATINFDEASSKLQQAYSEVFPDKSEYEL